MFRQRMGRPDDFEVGAEGSVDRIMSGGLPVTGFHASHASGKRQSVVSQSGSEAEEQSYCSSSSSHVASETSYEDSSSEDDMGSGFSSVASSAPVVQRRTWTLCLEFDKRCHDKDVIGDQIRHFLAYDLKKSGHWVEMESRFSSEQWGGYLEREVFRYFSCSLLFLGSARLQPHFSFFCRNGMDIQGTAAVSIWCALAE